MIAVCCPVWPVYCYSVLLVNRPTCDCQLFCAKAELCDRHSLPVVRSVCLFVCEQDYCKSNQPITVKLGVMIGPTNRKN